MCANTRRLRARWWRGRGASLGAAAALLVQPFPVGLAAAQEECPTNGLSCAITEDCVLPVQRCCQETTHWCWAAAAEMITRYLQHGVSQCDQVNRHFGTTHCCQDPWSWACDRSDAPHFDELGFTYQSCTTARTWEQVQDQIACQGKPWGWVWSEASSSNTAGHMVVVFGYALSNGVPWLLVHDPLPVCGTEDPAPDAPNNSTRAELYHEYVHGHVDESGVQMTHHWIDYVDVTWTGRVVRIPRPEIHELRMLKRPRLPQPPEPPFRPPAKPVRLTDSLRPALKSVATFRQLAGPQTYQLFGFQALGEVARARPTMPLALYWVALDDLRGYQAATAPERLLRNTGRVIVPLAVGRQVRSSVTLRRRADAWEPTSFGDAAQVRLLVRAQRRSAHRELVSPHSYFVVRLPFGPNRYLLGHRDRAGQLILTPTVTDRGARLVAGVDRPAAQVLAALAPIARATHGMP